MLDSIVDSPVVLTLLCGLIAALVVSLGFMSPFRFGLAMSAPARFPVRAVARAALVAFVLLINAASLGIAHRLPVGSTLVAVGFLMLLFLPKDEPDAA